MSPRSISWIGLFKCWRGKKNCPGYNADSPERIALCGCVTVTSPGENSALRDRRVGCERAMTEAGLPIQIHVFEERHIDESGMDTVSEEERAYRLARTLLGSVDLPFAVFTTDAPILAGLWRAIQDRGLPHVGEIGRRSVRILQERIAGIGPDEPYRLFIEPEIITSKV